MPKVKNNRSRNRRPQHPAQSAKVGMAPGSLIYLGEHKTAAPVLTLIEYDDDELMESHISSLESANSDKKNLAVTWLNVHGVHDPELMAAIGRRFGLHPLVLEDIMSTHQRPKADDYGDYLFLVAHFFAINEETGMMAAEQVSLVLGQGFVLSFQERPSGRFDPVRERLRQSRGQIRKLGADYLAYSLLDAIVDRYFSVLENIGERTDALEDQMLEKQSASLLQVLHALKRETLSLRRSVWPLREVINVLMRTDDRFFQTATRPYLRDVYDHTVHIIESLEASRDVIAGLLDLYLSSVSNRVNQEVRTLTVAAIMFMPATLIAGIFGMNFKDMPLLENPSGFYEATGVMAVVAVVLGALFWKLRWLK